MSEIFFSCVVCVLLVAFSYAVCSLSSMLEACLGCLVILCCQLSARGGKLQHWMVLLLELLCVVTWMGHLLGTPGIGIFISFLTLSESPEKTLLSPAKRWKPGSMFQEQVEKGTGISTSVRALLV